MGRPGETWKSRERRGKARGDGKRVVAKETPHIATERHVILFFNLQAVYGFFPALGKLGRPGETWGGRERCGEARIDVGRIGERWEGWERRREDGRDVGRPGETWKGWERRGEDGRDMGRMGETWGGRDRRG